MECFGLGAGEVTVIGSDVPLLSMCACNVSKSSAAELLTSQPVASNAGAEQ